MYVITFVYCKLQISEQEKGKLLDAQENTIVIIVEYFKGKPMDLLCERENDKLSQFVTQYFEKYTLFECAIKYLSRYFISV